MNTEERKLPEGWEALLTSRWQRGKVQKKTQLIYTLWGKVQIRGKRENPSQLSVFVTGTSSKWIRAGILKWKDNRWVYHPEKTSFAPATLEATIIRYLQPEKRRKTAKEINKESQRLTDFSEVQKIADELTNFEEN